MDTFSLNKALRTFGEVIETPTDFLNVNKQIQNDIKSNIKEIYDYTKKEEVQPRKLNPLSNLFVKGLDSEQIWQQVEIQNENVLTSFISNISAVLIKKDALRFVNLEEDKNKPDSGLEDTDNSENESDGSEKSSENGETETFNDTTKTFDSDSGDLGSEDEEVHQKQQAVVDDNFFKLSEMEDFLNKEEKKLAGPVQDDQSDSEESEGEGSIDLFKGDKEIGEETLEEEDESKLARFKDYFVAKDEPIRKRKPSKLDELMEDDGSGDDEDEIEEIKSSLQRREESLRKKISKLEEQAVSEKPWQLKGEITADGRPQNSLLEEVVGFDLTSRPAPVITEQASLLLEDIIKQRIKDKVFDSVERKSKPIETPLEYKKKLVLDQEKSKHSLTQIYEQEYSKQQADLDPGNADKEEQEPELHNQVRTLMKSVFAKLDALSNFHFTSKPTIPELKIISHLPAINMEEVAPVAASEATLLAPEEIKNKSDKMIGKSEKTSSDKKRERRKKKLKQKIHSKLRLKKENLKIASSKAKKAL